MNDLYDFIVVGAGISACTVVLFLNTRFPNSSILLVEHGRRLGGRSTTRKARNKFGLAFDHGLPSISFNKNISHDLNTLVSQLIQSNKLIEITNDILLINEFGDIDKIFTNQKIYRGFPYMINLCKQIINQSINPNKINFLYETCVNSFFRRDQLWEVKINYGRFIKSKNLILSSFC